METTRKISGIATLAAVLWPGGGNLKAQDSPTLVFSSFFGTPWEDEGSAVAVDPAGFTYVAGLYDWPWRRAPVP